MKFPLWFADFAEFIDAYLKKYIYLYIILSTIYKIERQLILSYLSRYIGRITINTMID